jgi:co-chaperonin GroES (HSP10)
MVRTLRVLNNYVLIKTDKTKTNTYEPWEALVVSVGPLTTSRVRAGDTVLLKNQCAKELVDRTDDVLWKFIISEEHILAIVGEED